jgi:hypothetical protein
MRRIGLVCVLAIALATFTVSAQSTQSEFCVQSDSGHAFIVFNRTTGDYKFIRCADNVAFSGTGQVRTDGCFIFLEDNRESYSVNIAVNMCRQAAKVFVDVPQLTPINGSQVPQMRESFQDSNISNSICGCNQFQAPPGGGGDPEFIGPPVEEGPSNPAPEQEVAVPIVLSVQSDSGHAFIVFNRTTGDYKFVRCSDGVAFSGTGQVRADGCFIFLEDNRATYKVIVTVNTCNQVGKVFVEAPQETNTSTGTPIPAMSESFGDSNIQDNTNSCVSRTGPAPRK